MDYDEIFDLRDRWKSTRRYIWIFVVIGIILILSPTCFYTVEPDERAVILRFGKYIKTTGPGLHFKLPVGIEKAIKVKVEYVFKEEFGFRTERPGVRTKYSSSSYEDESIMLTGDLNIADIQWIVQYKIKDPYKVLFHIKDPVKLIRDLSESVVRQIVGDRSITDILEHGTEINILVQESLQKILDTYDVGIHIVTVKLQDVLPPKPVQPAFNEVEQAKQERQRLINQAWQEYYRRIPLARGEAKKTIEVAEGYAINAINRAKGDVARFLQLYKAYSEAKEITRKRLYLETMQEVLPRAGKKYIIDPENKGLLPLLNIDNSREVK